MILDAVSEETASFLHKRTTALFLCVKGAVVCGLFIEKSCHELLHGVLIAEAGTFTDAVHGKHRVAEVDGKMRI